MNDIPTSPDPTAIAQPRPAASILSEWQRIFVFLKRPTLRADQPDPAPLTMLARVYALDMAAMFVLTLMASAAIANGFDLPKTALADAELTLLLACLIIVVAPVAEELLFRGWLSGKPGLLIAFAILAIVAAVFAFIPDEGAMRAAYGLFAMVAFLTALAVLIVLRKLPAPRWFQRFFPAFFWLSTVSFALVHLANFSEGTLVILLPLVLPQFVLGGLLGYVRVRIGLWAAIVLHAAHNATAFGISALVIALE